MEEKILFVDDDPNVLSAYQRQLRKQFTVDTALGGELGLTAIANHGPYSVIVADMGMPGMNGVQFLSRVKEIAPDTVRIMLTGNADQQTAMNAINEGNIFRFLTKPCQPEVITKVLTAGIGQYRLVTSEKDLLEKTLNGSVKVLTDVLALVNPTAFGRTSRIYNLVKTLSVELKIEKPWQIELAAMLSQIGCITMSEEALVKIYRGGNLTEQEMLTFQAHPRIGSSLIACIPRLENVAEIIACQELRFCNPDTQHGVKSGADIPMGARILKLIIDFDSLVTTGMNNGQALEAIQKRHGWYDQTMVDALKKIIVAEKGYEVKYVKTSELTTQMILADDIKTGTGTLFAAQGSHITLLLRIRLINLAQAKSISEPIKVFVVT